VKIYELKEVEMNHVHKWIDIKTVPVSIDTMEIEQRCEKCGMIRAIWRTPISGFHMDNKGEDNNAEGDSTCKNYGLG